MTTELIKAFLTCTLLLAIIACNSTEQNKVSTTNNIDEFQTYRIDPLTKATNIFDHIESIEVLGLEETPESLLGFVGEMALTQDKIIFKNGNQHELLIYTKDGAFLNKLSLQGDGPEEYREISSFWINDNAITIHDRGNSKIITFDFNGKFLTQSKLPDTYLNVHGYEDSYVADISDRVVQDSLRFNLMFPAENAYSIPINEVKNGVLWLLTPFSTYGNDLLYKNSFGDTLFKIKDNSTTPLLSVDFGDKWLWKDKELYNSFQKQRQAMSPDGMVNMYMPIISPDQFLFTTVKRTNGLFLVQRSSGVYKRFDLKKSGQEKYFLQAKMWENDKAVFSLSSSQIADLLSEVGPDKTNIMGTNSLAQIEASENPVLLWIKFKTLN